MDMTNKQYRIVHRCSIWSTRPTWLAYDGPEPMGSAPYFGESRQELAERMGIDPKLIPDPNDPSTGYMIMAGNQVKIITVSEDQHSH